MSLRRESFSNEEHDNERQQSTETGQNRINNYQVDGFNQTKIDRSGLELIKPKPLEDTEAAQEELAESRARADIEERIAIVGELKGLGKEAVNREINLLGDVNVRVAGEISQILAETPIKNMNSNQKGELKELYGKILKTSGPKPHNWGEIANVLNKYYQIPIYLGEILD
jgi:hypothetical protein